MHTSVVDTLATQAEQQAALVAESGQGGMHTYRHKQTVVVDTLPPDPRLMGPMAPGQPLTMKPEMLRADNTTSHKMPLLLNWIAWQG